MRRAWFGESLAYVASHWWQVYMSLVKQTTLFWLFDQEILCSMLLLSNATWDPGVGGNRSRLHSQITCWMKGKPPHIRKISGIHIYCVGSSCAACYLSWPATWLRSACFPGNDLSLLLDYPSSCPTMYDPGLHWHTSLISFPSPIGVTFQTKCKQTQGYWKVNPFFLTLMI